MTSELKQKILAEALRVGADEDCDLINYEGIVYYVSLYANAVSEVRR